jgi:glycosyltransferase involved in cell wall biosynthesis
MVVVALMAAYNEADVIAQVVGDLIRQGVQVYLIDHGSSDETVAQVTPFLGHGLIAVERFPEESGFPAADAGRYAWESLLRRKESLAGELEADWFLHADADELRESPWPGMSLVEAIAAVDALGYNAIDFQVFNFWPTHDDFRPGDDLRQAFRYYELGAPHDRPQIKGWKRTRGPVDLSGTGGHQARFAGRRVFPVRFVLRHYPIRSQAHGERKVFQERQPRFIAAERARGWHVQYTDLSPGHRFLRSPHELTPWDDLATRLSLALSSPAVESAEERAAEAERATAQVIAAAEHVRIEVEAARLERELRAGELAQLYAERERREADMAVLRQELLALRAELATARQEREARAGEAGQLYAERERREAALAALRQELLATREELAATERHREERAAEAAQLYAERTGREVELASVREELTTTREEREARAAEAAQLYAERGGREAEVALLREQMAVLRDELAVARREREARAGEAAQLYAERTRRETELAATRLESAEREAEIGRLRLLLEQRAAALADLQRQRQADGERDADARAALEAELAHLKQTVARHAAIASALDQALGDAYGRLDQFYGSRTWRWAAPARLLWRLIGRQ